MKDDNVKVRPWTDGEHKGVKVTLKQGWFARLINRFFPKKDKK